MAADAKDEDAEAAVDRFMRGTKERKRVTWEDRSGAQRELEMQVLTCAEIQVCHADAYQRFQKLKIPVGEPIFAPLFADETIVHLLFAACRTVKRERIAKSADELRSLMTDEERADLFHLYSEFQVQFDPAPEQISEKRKYEIGDAIKKKDGARLRKYGSFSLASFLLFTDSQQSTLPTGNSKSSLDS